MYTRHISTMQTSQKPQVQTYPNHEAIINMKLKQAEKQQIVYDKNEPLSNTKAHPINKDKDENLLMLILTLMLSLDGESDGMIYLLIALTMFIDN